MKIVHVETGRHLYGGAQQVLYIVRGLRDRGVDNLLVCPPGSEIARSAERVGLPLALLDCSGDLDLAFVWRLRKTLAAFEPDVVHCHSRRGADFLGGQAAAMLGIPAVVSRRVDNREPNVLAALRYHKFERIVAISAAIADVLREAGVAPARVCVIRSAVDVERFEATPARSRLADEFQIGETHFALACAAQLIPRKGQRILLEALATVTQAHPELRAVLFGRGPDEAELKAHCSRLGLDGVVQFAGFRSDLDEYLGAFDALVHPALAEGLGVITLKAQAAGVPVIASAVGGLTEAVADGESGLLVTPGEVAALAAAIAPLLDDSALRARYASAGRQRMRESFSIDAMVDAHLKLYEAVLDGRE